MLQHLTNAGYTGSVEALTAESGVSLAQYEEALADLAKCVELDGSDADVHFLRAPCAVL